MAKSILGALIFFSIISISCNVHNTNNQSGTLNIKFEQKPNIVWIVAEDLSPYIPSFGDSTIVTPNLDKLAANGVSFDNFYSAHPVCAPARASIITGMYANSIGASHMRTGPWYVDNINNDALEKYAERLPEGVRPYEAVPPSEVKMFTEYLRGNGYYCTNNSKQDYQFKKTMTAWDESSKKAHWKNREKGQPFFSVFNLEVTHESRIWTKNNDSLWVDKDLEVPVPPYLPNTEIAKSDIRRMYSNIKEMDAKVGAILTQLENDHLMDNTIIMWYTDHGGPLPRQKRLLYDSGLKVPMIIQFPDKKFKGLRDSRMISFIDLAPTLLSLANINPPEYMNGKAFLGHYIRESEPKYVFGAADRFDEKTDRIRSVRDKQFKYIKNYFPDKPMYLDVAYRNQMAIMQELHRLRKANQLTEVQALWFRNRKPKEELYDTATDPHELNNLADLPEFQEKLIELRQACENWILAIEDTGMTPEKELNLEYWPSYQQPVTTKPIISSENEMISIHSNTAGASIGYKIVATGEDSDLKSWSVYTKPFVLPHNATLIAIAHRIGYKRSNPIKLND